MLPIILKAGLRFGTGLGARGAASSTGFMGTPAGEGGLSAMVGDGASRSYELMDTLQRQGMYRKQKLEA